MGKRYRVSINTDKFSPFRCSKKRWEMGTYNSEMKAMNGWHATENSLQEVRWRLETFLNGGACGLATEELIARYRAWKARKRNVIDYRDEPCGIDRTMQFPEAPGFHQGYVNIDKLINTLREKGVVEVPFRAAYDSRQYARNMDGCYLRTEAVG